MLIKAGVDISRLRPEIRKKLNIIEEALERFDDAELKITSTYEGNHCAGSLHYAHLAVDVGREKAMTYAYREIKRVLGKDYDVILKPNHIHIEYDPK